MSRTPPFGAPEGRAAALTLPQAVERAFAAYRGGDLAAAERLCRAVLGAKADHFDALHLLGIVAARTGRPDEALDALRRAVAANPRDAAAHSHLGNVLRGLNRPGEAVQSYDRALALVPDYAEARYNRGNALLELGRFAEAAESYERALARMPGLAPAHNNRGVALNALRRPAEALECYARALALAPDYAEAHNNRGVALLELRRHAEALESCDRALRLNPDYAAAHGNRGMALFELGRHAEALESLDRALALAPDYAEGHYRRGIVLDALDRPDEALASYERALALRPDYAEAHNSRGIALFAAKRYAEAIAACERALALAPEHDAARWNLALCRLLLGDFRRGWQDYEWRPQRRRADLRRDFAQPLWSGADSPEGRTMLLHAEQGLGDTLQFCRYASELARLGARVLLEVPAPLAPLLAGLDGVAQVVPEGSPLPAFDCHCPLPSLPLAFGTDLDSIPARVPYLRSDAARVDAWRARLGVAAGPRVGLAWRGSAAHRNDRNRSIPLADLLPLASDAAEWISLQKDVSEADAALLASRPGIRRVDAQLADFADTAALVELLDLVVTVDTSVAHLAGAMGKPVWILLPWNPDWRWLLDRDDSPWYPTARLFRQPARGDWASVVRNVREALEQRFGERFRQRR